MKLKDIVRLAEIDFQERLKQVLQCYSYLNPEERIILAYLFDHREDIEIVIRKRVKQGVWHRSQLSRLFDFMADVLTIMDDSCAELAEDVAALEVELACALRE